MIFNEKYLVTVVDNDLEELSRVSEIFEDEGYEVTGASDFEQLLFGLEEVTPDLLVVNFKNDLELKKEIFLKIRGDERFIELPTLGIFDSITPEVVDHYIDLGIESICTYPFTAKEVLLRSEHLIEIIHARRNIEQKELAISAMFDEVKNLKLELKSKYEDIATLRDKISRVAVLDGLTGLFNRTYALEQLEMAISRFNRKKIESSVILCDIDDFKDINSEYSHNIGDKVIREVALELTSKKRNQDIFARYAGESFIIILPDTDADGAKYFAERARDIIENNTYTDQEIKITMTFGVAAYNQVMPLDMLMKMTEDALKFGKQSGKNKVLVANEMLNLS